MVKWTPKSEDDLDDLREYIAKNFGVKLAIEIANNLVDYTENLLSVNPLYGRLFEQNRLFSMIIYQGNAIYYCENPKDKIIYIIYVKCRGMEFDNERLLDPSQLNFD